MSAKRLEQEDDERNEELTNEIRTTGGLDFGTEEDEAAELERIAKRDARKKASEEIKKLEAEEARQEEIARLAAEQQTDLIGNVDEDETADLEVVE